MNASNSRYPPNEANASYLVIWLMHFDVVSQQAHFFKEQCIDKLGSEGDGVEVVHLGNDGRFQRVGYG